MKVAARLRQFLTFASWLPAYVTATVLAILTGIWIGGAVNACDIAMRPPETRCERVAPGAARLKVSFAVGDFRFSAAVTRHCYIPVLA